MSKLLNNKKTKKLISGVLVLFVLAGVLVFGSTTNERPLQAKSTFTAKP